MFDSENVSNDATNLTFYQMAINGQVDLFDGYPSLLMDIAVICCIIFITVGVPGNLITIVALLRHSKAHHATGIFIINLSITDLLFGCFNLPLATSLFWKRRWVHGETLCTLFPLLRYGLLAVSIFTVLAITLNRYVMIGHPRIYPKLYTRRNLIIMILLTWVGCFSSLIPVLIGQWGKFGLDLAIGSCSILRDKNGRSPKEFLFIVAFVLPCIAIIVCYARIFTIVRRAAAASRGAQPQASIRRLDEMKAQRPFESVSGSDESQRISESTKSSGVSDHDVVRPLYRPSVLRHRPLNTVLMFKEKQAAIRIEVDKGSEAVELPDDETCGLSNSYNRINADYLLSPTTHLVHTASVKRRASDSSTHFEAGKLHRELSRRSSSLTSIKADPSRSKTGSPTLSNCSDRSNLRNMSLFGRGPPRRLSLVRVQNSGRLSSKDKRLLQMILVIFVSFFVCYMPITIVKLVSKSGDVIELNIISYLLIYMTTCINPIVYVVMSSEYRQAYKNLLTCNKDVLRRTGTFMFSKTSNWG